MIRVRGGRSACATTRSRPCRDSPSRRYRRSVLSCDGSGKRIESVSPNTVIASSKETPCFSWFSAASESWGYSGLAVAPPLRRRVAVAKLSGRPSRSAPRERRAARSARRGASTSRLRSDDSTRKGFAHETPIRGSNRSKTAQFLAFSLKGSVLGALKGLPLGNRPRRIAQETRSRRRQGSWTP